MRFKTLNISGFSAYADEQVVDLTTSAQQTLILFHGKNGAGKTSLADALRLALYGEMAPCSTRGRLKYETFLNDSIHNDRDRARIELDIECFLSEKNAVIPIKICRFWQRGDKKDTLQVFLDGWLDDGYTQTWNEVVERILPKGLHAIAFFDGEMVNQLLESDELPPDLVVAVKSVLGLQLPEILGQDMDTLWQRKQKKMGKRQTSELDKIQRRLSKVEEDRESLLREKQAQKEVVQTCHDNRQFYRERFLAEGGEQAQSRIEIERELSATQNKVMRLENAMRDYLSQPLVPFLALQPLIAQAIESCQHDEQIYSAQETLEALTEQAEAAVDYTRRLDGAVAMKLQDFLAHRNQTLRGIAEQVLLLGFPPNTAGGLQTLETPNKSALDQSLFEARKRVTELQRQLDAAPEQSKTRELEGLLEVAETKLREAQHELDAIEQDLNRANENYRQIRKELERLSNEAIAITNDEHILASIPKVKATLAKYKERILAKKIGALEQEIELLFAHLARKDDLVSKVSLDPEKFTMTLYYGGKPVNRQRISAGEKQMLALSFMWGLIRVSRRKFPIILDTLLGRLDLAHRTHVIERFLGDVSDQTILLATDSEIRDEDFKIIQGLGILQSSLILKHENRCSTITQQLIAA